MFEQEHQQCPPCNKNKKSLRWFCQCINKGDWPIVFFFLFNNKQNETKREKWNCESVPCRACMCVPHTYIRIHIYIRVHIRACICYIHVCIYTYIYVYTRIYGQLIYVHTYAQMCMQHLSSQWKKENRKFDRKEKKWKGERTRGSWEFQESQADVVVSRLDWGEETKPEERKEKLFG